MKLIIAGSRNIDFISTIDLHEIIVSHFNPYPDVIICGMARGPDLLGRAYGLQHNLVIEEYPALWDRHGKQAGFIRNRLMESKADCLLALWDGKSRGTKDMILCMLHNDKPVHVELYQT